MSELKIYNSLKLEKEVFKPITPGKINMYVCGMTVYDYCHLGHARVMVVFDVVYRYLKASGYDVTYVRNITDIDDKIIKRANENGEDIAALTDRFIAAMHEDEAALGVLRPDQEPRATNHIDDMHSMIQTLMDKGLAYVGSNGDVFYRVHEFEGYGKLSGKKLEDLRAGERVGVDEHKDDPLDFVLWKSAKPEEPSWPSPWGDGRPGWHIECSAMSTCCLGNHFDIHGGGMDLKFPHHENEIAQSEGATGESYVNYWMHNGFVRVDEEKMSKSLGNFFTVREILTQYHPEVVRFFILNSHYRSPLNYTDENLQIAKNSLEKFYLALRNVDACDDQLDEAAIVKFNDAMNDDFNTAEALAVLFEQLHEINRHKDNAEQAAVHVATLKQLGGTLGILQYTTEEFLQGGSSEDGLSNEEIDDLIAKRAQAKGDKNWGEADRIRDVLTEAGIVLEDGAGGTTWRRS